MLVCEFGINVSLPLKIQINRGQQCESSLVGTVLVSMHFIGRILHTMHVFIAFDVVLQCFISRPGVPNLGEYP